jgi:uncharacterized protein DUF3187
VRRGFRGGWMAGVRVPVHWRGGGWLDSVIDPFHDLFGFPDSGRSQFPRGRLRIEGRTEEGIPLDWEGGPGTALGSIELEVAKSVRAGESGGPVVSVLARVALPTSTGAFAGADGGIGAQALLSQPLGARFDVHAGAGVTTLGPGAVDGIGYTRTRTHGFAALEWRPLRAWSALVQWEASSRLATGIADYPGFQLALRLGSKVDLGPRWRIEGGFVEGIKPLETTVDFGVFAGLRRRF